MPVSLVEIAVVAGGAGMWLHAAWNLRKADRVALEAAAMLKSADRMFAEAREFFAQAKVLDAAIVSSSAAAAAVLDQAKAANAQVDEKLRVFDERIAAAQAMERAMASSSRRTP